MADIIQRNAVIADLEEANFNRSLPELVGYLAFAVFEVGQIDTAYFTGKGLFAHRAHQRLFFQLLQTVTL